MPELNGEFPYLYAMNKHFTAGLMALMIVLAITPKVASQTLTCAEIQGQVDVSPYEGQEVTVAGKVTEFFGDMWYLQDDFGAWNGLYCIGPDVLIDANPPWWNAPRQPEVGDVLELTGTIVEEDGNTQLVDITGFVFVDFWNATAAGTGTTVDGVADEALEGTRVRLDPVTVETAPDADGIWTASDATGTVKIYGVDTDDPGNNEDADGPTPGDVYRVYGAVRQIGEDYIIDLGDIDTLSLVVGLQEQLASVLKVYPNPSEDQFFIDGIVGAHDWTITDVWSRVVSGGTAVQRTAVDVTGLAPGRYTLTVVQDGVEVRRPLMVR